MRHFYQKVFMLFRAPCQPAGKLTCVDPSRAFFRIAISVPVGKLAWKLICIAPSCALVQLHKNARTWSM